MGNLPLASAAPSNAAQAAGTGDALERLSGMVAEDMEAVNALIRQRMTSEVPLIPQLAGYITAAGGKRLRPLLTLASARLNGHDGQRHIPLATAVEFIHTATLLHDDVVDESELRRGRASANAVFDNKASVLVGDFLFSRAFQLMVEDQSLEVLRILSQASATIAEGEVLQLTTTGNTSTSEAGYMAVIRAKTAELFAAAAEIGPVLGGHGATRQQAMRAYGHHLGMAFQLADDVLDYSAAQAELGKTVGDDFAQGKMTLPVVLAWQAGSDEERAFWQRSLVELDQRDGDLDYAMTLMRTRGALDGTLERAREEARLAREALIGLEHEPIGAALAEAADFAVARAY